MTTSLLTMVVAATAVQFLALGLETAGFPNHRNSRHATNLRRWHAHYGASPETVSQVFHDLQTTEIIEARLDGQPCAFEFLLPFFWLKTNASEERLAGMFGVNEKTARKWKWESIIRIAALKEQKVSPQLALFYASCFVCHSPSLQDCL